MIKDTFEFKDTCSWLVMHFSMQENMHWFLKWSASAVKASLAAQVVCWPTFVFLRPHHKPWIASFRCVWWKTRVLPSTLIGIRPSVRQSPGASDISKPGTTIGRFLFGGFTNKFQYCYVLFQFSLKNIEKWNNIIPVDCLVSFGDGWFNHQKPWISLDPRRSLPFHPKPCAHSAPWRLGRASHTKCFTTKKCIQLNK